ncbi:preQ(0) biosynthesis protein QueC [Bryocella elongata]|uniref:7-cyano-7-deazaguanine synthase n=1 Tax=Bryocella elongata TaxID=863522 RepID=A0A1H6CB63_9BACT|nr:7-cyano-7-deazaguanine synthase QueC [Bryocella elongata]SEG70174.1 preQ(0) biosynthesis protein QueC [Bryocella elongata]
MSEGTGKKAIVLLSGGLDSTTVVAMAHAQGYAVYALSFDYGQVHKAELHAAARVAKSQNVAQHAIIKLDLAALAHSALTGKGDVPKDRSLEEIGEGVPVTYVPARNTVFLSLALAWAESLGATDIFIGVNALDYSGYPDCRPEFIHAFETMANLATKIGTDGQRITIHTPLISMTKAQIVQAGIALGVDYSITTTCYDASDDGAACGSCDACLLRRRGFEEGGIADPTLYRGLTE